MKILVTGGAGFIGSALIRAAIAKGHSVINVDALTYAASLESLASIANSPDYVFEHADIRNLSDLTQVFDKHQPLSQRMRVNFCQRFEKALGQASLILVLQIDAAVGVPQDTGSVA